MRHMLKPLPLTLALLVTSTCYGQLADTAWPMFQGDLRHTGRSEYAGPASNPTVEWYGFGGGVAFRTDGSLVVGGDSTSITPAIDTDGTAYTSVNRSLFALNPDGSTKWQYDTGYYLYSSPTIADTGVVYVGGAESNGANGRFFAVNPDGNLAWSYLTALPIQTSPAVADDGTVYFLEGGLGLGPGAVHAFTPGGTRQWGLWTGNDLLSSPSIGDDGTIYVAGAGLQAIDPNGSAKWRYSAGTSTSTPAIGPDGTIYFGNGVHGGSHLYGDLHAVTPAGEHKWHVDLGDWVAGPPVVDKNGVIYIGAMVWGPNSSSVYTMHAVSDQGTVLWSLDLDHGTGGLITASPAIGPDGTLYISSGADLYAITPEPATLSLLVLGACLPLLRRRR